ncbi:hypothetical protein AM587_10012027 [Phytophthora nicotianae]|uniref:Exodeoxyribonuclease X-like C-terminal domain-containing protein n=1 Tax=Phytophthora nicotianae TaxID=4792 RepID=A0A0W8DYD2_PHYNI|nr:hypothetical protein AM587_10012027 [Phytophthora nicotianae]
MTDVTQLSDEFLLQSSLKNESVVDVSKGKKLVVLPDLQQGSYTSGTVTYDATATAGSQGYASLKDAYITVPQKLMIEEDSDIGKFLKKKFANDDGSYVMTYGKYKNKTIKQILNVDRQYLEWLFKSSCINEKAPKLKAALIEALM